MNNTLQVFLFGKESGNVARKRPKLRVCALFCLFLLSGCFWGTVDVTLSQRTSGTVALDLYVPYMLKDLHISGGALLPFPSDETEFRNAVSALPGTAVQNLDFENSAAGLHISGTLRYQSIEGLLAVGGFLMGREIENRWNETSTIQVELPLVEMKLDETPVLRYYQNLLTKNKVYVRFLGRVNIARVENGTRNDDGTVVFEFTPSELLETPQNIAIGW